MSFDDEDYLHKRALKKRTRKSSKQRTGKGFRSSGSKNPNRFGVSPNYKKIHRDTNPGRLHPQTANVSQKATLVSPVELSNRSNLSTNDLRVIAKEILLANQSEVDINKLITVKRSHSASVCREICSYIPYHLIQSTREQLKTQITDISLRLELSCLLQDATNSALFRREIAQRKFWLTRKIEENDNVNPPALPSVPPLIPVYKKSGLSNPILRYRKLSDEESSHLSCPMNQNEIPPGHYQNSSVTLTLERFKRNVRSFSRDILKNVSFDNMFLSGGAVVTCLLPLPDEFHARAVAIEDIECAIYDSVPLPRELQDIIASMVLRPRESRFRRDLANFYDIIAPTSDIDLFFTGNSRLNAFRALETTLHSILDNLQERGEDWKLVRSHNAITVCVGNGIRNIQLIISFVQDIREHLCFADIDCTAVAYDGTSVWCTERSIRALNTNWNFVPPATLERESVQTRIQKYQDRGFGCLLYELCKHEPRCDVVPTPETHQYLYELNNRVFEYPDTFALNYHPKVELETMMEELNLRQERMGNAPWRVGYALPDVIFPQDNLPVESSATQNDSTKNLSPMRWKRCDTVRLYSYLLPRCYMCKKARVSVEQTSTKNRLVPLCVNCADFNQQKKEQKANMKEKIALVTGGRIKIGFECVLSLLRNGALVIVTTRFPYDACKRFQKEDDYALWKDQVHVYGVDFRNLSSVQSFIQHVITSYEHLDILINNAAQTIHRPPVYYERVASLEVEAHATADSFPLVKNVSVNPYLLADASQYREAPNSVIAVASHAGTILPATSPDIQSPLFSSQYCLVPVMRSDNLDERDREIYFPENQFDEHCEPADLRPQNSWNSSIQDVHPVELLEVQLVNSMVPSMFLSQFTELLEKARIRNGKAFVINVSSSEGQFAAPKYGGHHAHTNMAKAALNMLTRTVADTMATKGIYVNSVDTGWVTKMTPGGAQTNQTAAAPLSPRDGAARILDPIYSVLNGNVATPVYGKLFKDYTEASW